MLGSAKAGGGLDDVAEGVDDLDDVAEGVDDVDDVAEGVVEGVDGAGCVDEGAVAAVGLDAAGPLVDAMGGQREARARRGRREARRG